MRPIAVITTSYPRNAQDDAGIFVKRLVDALSIEGFSGIVIVPRDGTEPAIEMQGSFEVHRFRYGIFTKGRLAFGAGMLPNLRAEPLLILQLPGLLFGFTRELWKARRAYDVIHANWLVAGIAGAAAAPLVRKPFIVTVRGEDAKLLQHPLLSCLLRNVLAGARFIVTVSNNLKEKIELPLRAGSKLCCIPNGVAVPYITESDRHSFRAEKGLELNKRYLVFVGRVIALKGLETLIRILSGLPQDFELLILGRSDGSTYQANLETLAGELGVSSRVRFCGLVPPDEAPHYLYAARYYVTASSYEGRPNAVLEGLAAGLPVVASDIPAHREILEGNSAGFLFNPEEPDHAAQWILRTEAADAAYDRLSGAASEIAGCFSWKQSAIEYGRLFNSIAR